MSHAAVYGEVLFWFAVVLTLLLAMFIGVVIRTPSGTVGSPPPELTPPAPPPCRGPEAGACGGRPAAGVRLSAVGPGAKAAGPGSAARPECVMRSEYDGPGSSPSAVRVNRCGQHPVRRPGRGPSPGTPPRRSPSPHRHRPGA